MIYQLIYRSQATKEFWPDDLFALVEKSRQNNEPRRITGMLLFHEGNFLQLLEGPEAGVKDCFQMVSGDPRHSNIETLMTRETEARDFPEWTMGFERLDEAWNMPREWATILEDDFSSERLTKHPSAVKASLLSFRHAMH
jgi:hypothetical protein